MTAALDVLGALVLEDGRRWAEAAVPVQLADARAVLDGPVPFHFQTRPRGMSKTTDAAGVALAALDEQLPPGGQAYAVAADRDQAALLIREMAGFVARSPAGLWSGGRRPEVSTYSVTAASGATLTALAADGASAYGLRPHLLIADEVAQWGTTPGPRLLWEAVFSSMAKVSGARLLVLTTAGDPAHWCHRIIEQARSSKRWRVSETPGPAPWVDPGALEEQRRVLLPSAFARLHLNQWTAAEDRLVSADALRECVSLEGPLRPQVGTTYVISLDVGLTNDRTVAAVCHAEPWGAAGVRNTSLGELERDRDWVSGAGAFEAAQLGIRTSARAGRDGSGRRIVLDRLQVWEGSRKSPVRLSAVGEWILEASRAFNDAPVVYDPFQAVGLAQRLQDAGVKTSPFTFSSASVGRLASTLFTLLRDRALVLPDDEDLLEELANVRLRETSPGVLRMDHDSGKHDDRATALALAAYTLLETPEPQRAGQFRYELGDKWRGVRPATYVGIEGDPNSEQIRDCELLIRSGHPLASVAERRLAELRSGGGRRGYRAR